MVANESVQLMPFTPAAARERKKYIESILSKLRATAEEESIRTQISPSVQDIKVFIKTKSNGFFGKYKEINLKLIDPHNYAPKFWESQDDNKNIKEVVRNPKEEIEAANATTKDGFHVQGRKRGRNSNENLVRKRLKSSFEDDEEKVVDNLLDFLNLRRRIEES